MQINYSAHSPQLRQVKSEVGSWKPTTNLLTSFFLITFLLSSFVSFSQSTHIPDANFRKALLNKYGITADSNNTILNSDAIAVDTLRLAKNFNTPNSDKIRDLSGIEAFTALTYLDCRYNLLTSLDLSANTTLIYLYCDGNQLSTLNVSAQL